MHFFGLIKGYLGKKERRVGYNCCFAVKTNSAIICQTLALVFSKFECPSDFLILF